MDTLDQLEGRKQGKIRLSKIIKNGNFLGYDFDFVIWLEAKNIATNQKTDCAIQTGTQKSLFGSLVSEISAPTQCPNGQEHENRHFFKNQKMAILGIRPSVGFSLGTLNCEVVAQIRSHR